MKVGWWTFLTQKVSGTVLNLIFSSIYFQQEMASDTDIEGIIVALKHLTDTIEDLLKYGREAVQG